MNYNKLAGFFLIPRPTPTPPSLIPDPSKPTPFDNADLMHSLANKIHIIILGSSGIIYQYAVLVLQHLGVHHTSLTPLLQSLHVHAVLYAHYIVVHRRRLERLPSEFQSSRMTPGVRGGGGGGSGAASSSSSSSTEGHLTTARHHSHRQQQQQSTRYGVQHHQDPSRDTIRNSASFFPSSHCAARLLDPG